MPVIADRLTLVMVDHVMRATEDHVIRDTAVQGKIVRLSASKN